MVLRSVLGDCGSRPAWLGGPRPCGYGFRTEMCTRVVVESLAVPQAHGPGLALLGKASSSCSDLGMGARSWGCSCPMASVFQAKPSTLREQTGLCFPFPDNLSVTLGEQDPDRQAATRPGSPPFCLQPLCSQPSQAVRSHSAHLPAMPVCSGPLPAQPCDPACHRPLGLAPGVSPPTPMEPG